MMLYSVLFFFFNVYSFIFCNHFILVWAMADLKPIPGKMGIHPGWDKSIIHIFIHSFSPRHNLFRPTHLLPCFWEVGKKKKNQRTHGKPIKTQVQMGNSKQTVTHAQDQTEDCGAVRWQFYSLCHHSEIFFYVTNYVIWPL